jgi:LysR family glycine cleavage system transcriptional activator
LAIGPLRAFEAVGRLLSFRGAAEELHLTQSAVSRQIQALEDELGQPLFLRGTRHVELTAAGVALRPATVPLVERLDSTVRQLRTARSRRTVSLTTFASFASLWLIPRLQAFQAAHPDIDIRVSATDNMSDLDDPEIDIALRYCHPDEAPANAVRLFGDTLTPAAGAALMAQSRQGLAPPLRRAADLVQHTLLEEDDHRPSAQYLSWRYWLRQHGQAQLQPQRWIYLNFTYQQIQAALAGQGVALARLPLVYESLQRGELVEPFGVEGRLQSPFAYWAIPSAAGLQRPELRQFLDWVIGQAAQSRTAIGEP